MTKKEKLSKQIQELRDRADRRENSVSSSAGPSSQEWVSPERRAHYYQLANDDRKEADRLQKLLDLTEE